MSVSSGFTVEDDVSEHYRMELSNGALVHFPTRRNTPADATFTLTKPALLSVVGAGSLDGVQVDGDASVWEKLFELTDEADPDFPIVTP